METKALRDLWQLAFGDSEEFIGFFFNTAYAPERCCTLTVDGTLAAALYWLDAEYAGQKLAYIYAVATHPDFRNQGLCRALMEKTHTLLAGQDYEGALLMPAEEGLRQMYGKMGYRECCTVTEFSCTAGTPIPVRSIDKSEYTLLRRKLLPPEGVIQEGPSIDYLASYSRFYAGETFLLCAVPDKNQLQGIELLGDADAAPGILSTLGYSKGSFRTPGKDLPFVMFCPLRTGVKPPVYCGLVFD